MKKIYCKFFFSIIQSGKVSAELYLISNSILNLRISNSASTSCLCPASQCHNEPLAESRQQQNRLFIGSVEETGEFAALNEAQKKNNNDIKSKYPVEILVGGRKIEQWRRDIKTVAMQSKATITHLAFIFCN